MALHPSFLARTPSVVAHTAGRLSASFASGPTALGLALQRLARTGLLCPSLARTSSSLSGRQPGHLRSLFFAFVIPGQELFRFFPHLARPSQRPDQILPDIGPIEPAGLDHPLLQLRHHRTAVLLMISQPLLIAHSRRLLLVLVDFPDLLQHVVTRLRIDSSYLHEFPSRVDQALADDSFSLSTKVAGQRV